MANPRTVVVEYDWDQKENRMKMANRLNFSFKVLECIVMVDTDAPDMEKAQEVNE